MLWEEQGITKQGLAEFYLEIADWILPHIVGRPLALVRCPSGSEKGCFFQKHPGPGSTLDILRDRARQGRRGRGAARSRHQGVVALVQVGVLEIHPWGATIADLEQPDRIVFDLDPGRGRAVGARSSRRARELRQRLGASARSFVKTTGGKGLHVVVPLRAESGWDEVKAFAQAVAEAWSATRRDASSQGDEGDAPRQDLRRLSAQRPRRDGGGCLFDSRPRRAPVATPLDWDELSPGLTSNHFTVANLPARLAHLTSDPWAELFKLKQTLPK